MASEEAMPALNLTMMQKLEANIETSRAVKYVHSHSSARPFDFLSCMPLIFKPEQIQRDRVEVTD